MLQSTASVKRALPEEIDRKLYEHLTHKERMIAGFPYDPLDDELLKERIAARKLTRQFNQIDDEDTDGRRAIIDKLFNPNSKYQKIIIEPPFQVDYGYNITVGNNLQVNFGCVILDCAPINIGDNCLVAPGVQIYAATHPLNAKYRQDNEDYYELAYPVTIGNNVWIGGHAIICPGVTIGDNCVIGAGAVVTKNVPSNVVVAGNPAKIIRDMNDEHEKQA